MQKGNLKFIIHASFCFTMAASLLCVSAQEKENPRVFVSDSKSWEMAGAGEGNIQGGARPQTAEIIKTFGKKCPEIIVTMKAEKADYVVLLEHEGGKLGLEKDNKLVVFGSDGDAIKSGSTRTVGGAVKDACAAVMKDWEGKARKVKGEK